MKKVLLGLLALSAVSMAVAPDLGAPPTAGGNVFKTGQEGAITVTGKMTSVIPVVKYVVYSSSDNGATMKSETLDLPDFVLTQDRLLTSGFVTGTDKIFVKRVNGTALADLVEVTDTVEFKLERDSAYTAANGAAAWLGAGKTVDVSAMSFVSKSVLDKALADSGISGYIVNDWGGLANVTAGKRYSEAKRIQAESSANGVYQLKTVVNSQYDENLIMDAVDAAAFETQIASGVAIGNARVLVRVK